MQMASRKIGLLLGVAMSLLLANPVRPQQPTPSADSDPQSYVKFGIDKASHGDLDGAIAAFNEAVRIDPKYAPAYEFLGKAYSMEHKIDQAIANYDLAIQYDAKSGNAYYQRGSLKGEKADFDGAIKDFSHVIEIKPQYAPALYNRGHAKYFKGDLDGAMTDLNQSISLDSKSPYGYFIRGLIHHAKSNRTEAMSDFEISTGLGFPYASFWYWRTQMESGQKGIAAQNLANNLAKPTLFKPDDLGTSIGNFLLGKITQDQLLEKPHVATGSEATGDLCEAWFYIGISKRLMGDLKGAQEAFEKALATQAKSSEEFVEAGREAAVLQKP